MAIVRDHRNELEVRDVWNMLRAFYRAQRGRPIEIKDQQPMLRPDPLVRWLSLSLVKGASVIRVIQYINYDDLN